MYNEKHRPIDFFGGPLCLLVEPSELNAKALCKNMDAILRAQINIIL
jgi:hypothetical protein